MTHASKHGHGERHSRKRAREMLNKSGYRAGGHVSKKLVGEMVRKGVGEHEANDHKGEKKTRLKLKSGGVADGMMAKPRADRRGSRKGKPDGHHVTIVNVGQQKPQPVPVPVPKPVPVPGGPPGMGAGPAMGGPGMGAPPPRPPMAGPPPGGMAGLKRGGRVRKKGGKVPMDAGAGSGEGRLEKVKAYGAQN